MKYLKSINEFSLNEGRETIKTKIMRLIRHKAFVSFHEVVK